MVKEKVNGYIRKGGVKVKTYLRTKRGKAPTRKKKRLSKHKPVNRKVDEYGRFV